MITGLAPRELKGNCTAAGWPPQQPPVPQPLSHLLGDAAVSGPTALGPFSVADGGDFLGGLLTLPSASRSYVIVCRCELCDLTRIATPF